MFTMFLTGRVVCVASLLLVCLNTSSGLSRQKRIVGGEPASPPPPGASEAEDVVENPGLVSVQPLRPPNSNSLTSTSPLPPNIDDDDGPIVFVRRGRRQARVKGRREPEGIYSWKGIRYADPPVGNLRFQRPRRRKLEGEVEATTLGPPCPQTIGKKLVGSEDCLFLNVFSPEVPKDSNNKKHPVIFWIHGGGFRRGSGSQYGVSDLVKKGLVVVTIQYRLGSLGFLSTSKKESPGNAGLFDIVASLKWVRNYIRFFGGDPDCVVVAGQGSGASAAMMITLTPFARSWVRGVFAMSGSAISSFAVDDDPQRSAKEVSAVDQCNAENDPLPFIRCMQKLPLETIIKGDDKAQEDKLKNNKNASQSYITSISKLLNPGPAVEGEDDFRFLPNFLVGTPLTLFQQGNFAKVPLLTGVTKDETSTSAKGGGLASKLLGQVGNAEELLEKLIPQLLKVNTGIFNSTLQPLVGGLFSNTQYLKGVTSSLNGVASTLDKVIEMTTDALFNLPAFLTSQYWSQQSKAYLYSFEHDSQSSASDDFLPEYPLTEQPGDTPVEGVGHGDDLVYLFDVRSLEGEPVESATLQEQEDVQVREHFTTMVAEFARSGVPKIAGQEVKPFTAEHGDYAIVNSQPTLAEGFRKCQMGLWAGLTEVLKSAECSFLQLGDVVNSLGAGGLMNLTKGATGALTTPLENNGLTNGLTGLLGGGGGGGGGGGNKAPKKPNILGLGKR